MAKKEMFVERKLTLADAVSEAFGDITSLAEEMREAFDNTPESLQQSSVGEAREAAADVLEGINEVDVPEELQEFEITFQVPNRTPKQQAKLSRAARRDDAVSLLDVVINRLNELAEDEEQTQARRDSAEELSGELESAKDEADGVEFPGMRG